MDLLVECRKFKVAREPVPIEGGGTGEVEIVIHPGSVVILPMLSADECVMIRNHRHAADRVMWEIPAGTLDKPEEAPIEAAIRELEEETGYTARRYEPLCSFYASPGFLSERMHVFVATNLTGGKQQLEPTERIQVEIVEWDRAMDMVRDGTIEDAKTLVALMRWDMHRREGTLPL